MITDEKKVSIIVPVYNVERYIENCLRSIQNQTYSNFEVILINDGSTDKSKKICEQFCEHDSRFSLYNQINLGLSSSRNVGLNIARGDLILFVDADDYISDELLEIAINDLVNNAVKVVIFSYYVTINNKQRIPDYEEPELGMVSRKEAVEKLLKGSFGSYSWKILAYKEVYENNNIKFPIARKYEDMATTYKIIDAVDNVFITSKRLYYYQQRANSITHVHSEKDLEDLLITFEEMQKYFDENYPELEMMVYNLEYNMIFMLLIRMGNWGNEIQNIFSQYSLSEQTYIQHATEHLNKIIKKNNKISIVYFKQLIKLVLLNIKIFPIIVFLKEYFRRR